MFLPLAISCFIDLGSILRYSVGSGGGLGTDLRAKFGEIARKKRLKAQKSLNMFKS